MLLAAYSAPKELTALWFLGCAAGSLQETDLLFLGG